MNQSCCPFHLGTHNYRKYHPPPQKRHILFCWQSSSLHFNRSLVNAQRVSIWLVQCRPRFRWKTNLLKQQHCWCVFSPNSSQNLLEERSRALVHPRPLFSQRVVEKTSKIAALRKMSPQQPAQGQLWVKGTSSPTLNCTWADITGRHITAHSHFYLTPKTPVSFWFWSQTHHNTFGQDSVFNLTRYVNLQCVCVCVRTCVRVRQAVSWVNPGGPWYWPISIRGVKHSD